MISAALALLIGLVVLGLGIWKLQGNQKTLAIGAGAVLVLCGAVLPGYGIWEDAIDLGGDTPAAVSSGLSADFEITPTSGSWGTADATITIADDDESATVSINHNSTSNYFDENYTAVNFSINPIAPVGATNDDLVTINFAVDETQKYGGEYIFAESSNTYGVNWSINGESVENYDGSFTMLYTETAYVELRMELDGSSTGIGAELDSVGESLTIPVRFTANGFSWTFDVNLIVVTSD